MLNEVEQMVNHHLEYFEEFEKNEPLSFKSMKRDIRKQELADN
jgi:hypothetical protein